MNLQQIREYLIAYLLEDLRECLRVFKECVLPESEVYAELILLEAQLNQANKQALLGIARDEELQLTYNRIRAALMQLIQQLEAEAVRPGFQPAPKSEAPKAAANKGNILYHIPDVMALQQEARCVVRIAFEEALVRENFEVTEETTIEAIRVAEVMQVEMIDPAQTPRFHIRTISSTEQVIDEDAYTEWVFYVTPLVQGTWPLVLKVAVIELVREKERRREIVLEEQIQILADQPLTESSPPAFKHSPQQLNLGPAPALAMPETMPRVQPESLPPPPPSPLPGGTAGAAADAAPVQQKRSPSAPSVSGKRRVPLATTLSVVLLLVMGSWWVMQKQWSMNGGAARDHPGPIADHESTEASKADSTASLWPGLEVCGQANTANSYLVLWQHEQVGVLCQLHQSKPSAAGLWHALDHAAAQNFLARLNSPGYDGSLRVQLQNPGLEQQLEARVLSLQADSLRISWE